jgi:hypothetical protein
MSHPGTWIRCETGNCCNEARWATEKWLLCDKHAITCYDEGMTRITQEQAWREMERRRKPWLVTTRERAYSLTR